jgi:hypothetical protein
VKDSHPPIITEDVFRAAQETRVNGAILLLAKPVNAEKEHEYSSKKHK